MDRDDPNLCTSVHIRIDTVYTYACILLLTHSSHTQLFLEATLLFCKGNALKAGYVSSAMTGGMYTYILSLVEQD